MAELLIELHYLPCLDYIAGIGQFERVWLEAHEHYQKQSYRNRTYVLTANKVDVLTVPVQQGTHHQAIRDL
ncbi:MAG TPA: WbqC family protein, partial [Spirosoma sp.]|nr:WbqC family protein [Spirosoma sp.]